jgi:initiation factor 1A
MYKKMVVNKTGGKKSKGFARKGMSDANRKIRYSEDPNEIYAIAVKMLGNGMFEAKCADDVSRICKIRGKFSGKRKSTHFVKPGVWVLVGCYEWDNDKSQKCDLLEVYADRDKDALLQTSANLIVLQKQEGELNNIEADALGDVAFEYEEEGEININDI